MVATNHEMIACTTLLLATVYESSCVPEEFGSPNSAIQTLVFNGSLVLLDCYYYYHRARVDLTRHLFLEMMTPNSLHLLRGSRKEGETYRHHGNTTVTRLAPHTTHKRNLVSVLGNDDQMMCTDKQQQGVNLPQQFAYRHR